ETRDCVLFDAVGAYTPGKGLKSMKINKIVVKVSNKEHYDRWMQTIIEAKKESFSPQIEN
ncbi:MAG: hypothetical protein Q8P49_00175, partial [Candidatus Liptonbacteria bacterium]|nr:hypothetical protein [Candidatus Liptonbacteria bacterium]